MLIGSSAAPAVADADSGPVGHTSTQVWFGDATRPRYGWLSLPASGTATGGVVLCPPVGEEGRAAHRTFRRLAEELADVGLAALRFDYDGTGDSAGGQEDSGRVDAWLASVADAASYLRDAGVPTVSAVAMRLGALLAAQVAVDLAAGGEGLQSLVLWDPCQSGRTFLREGEALFSFTQAAEHATEELDPAFRHTPGFQYTQDTARDLRRLDFAKLPALPDTAPLARRLLLLTREDRPQASGVVERLRLEGARLTERPALDQADLLDIAPSDNSVPQRSLREVVAWLVAGTVGVAPVPVKAAAPEHAVLLESDGTGSATIRERAVRLGADGVFGIAAEPVEPLPGVRPWVVLINVAAEHHIGPGRSWVDFSRRWAAMGIRTVRIDQSGIGDSPTRPGELEDTAFVPEWIEDMRQVVRTLSADGSPVLLIGLCSGAYSALEVALWEQVTGVLAVNPRLTLYPAAKGTPTYTPDRRAGIVPVRPIADLAASHRILAGGLWRIYRQVAVWHAPYRVIRNVVRRGTTVRLIACHDDAQHFTEVAFWRPSMWRLLRGRRFVFEEDEAFDHSLLGRHGQQVTWQRATEFLTDFHPEAARR